MTTTQKAIRFRDLNDFQQLMVLLRCDPFNPPKPHPACLPGEYIASEIRQYGEDGKLIGYLRTFKIGATVTRTDFDPI